MLRFNPLAAHQLPWCKSAIYNMIDNAYYHLVSPHFSSYIFQQPLLHILLPPTSVIYSTTSDDIRLIICCLQALGSHIAFLLFFSSLSMDTSLCLQKCFREYVCIIGTDSFKKSVSTISSYKYTFLLNLVHMKMHL